MSEMEDTAAINFEMLNIEPWCASAASVMKAKAAGQQVGPTSGGLNWKRWLRWLEK